ncbi:hypothetical protein VPNG_02481 [Cytospora leucostoma]|uniref:Fe2OG dioxygenase domain-containing protein n=1 Tax=Cytospora leucostoma TaxID=1230097 RepID=A0A423XHX2_9PEZI|nr:hypothetical protein VPNG_02481 [Cytospora leucostoma]
MAGAAAAVEQKVRSREPWMLLSQDMETDDWVGWEQKIAKEIYDACHTCGFFYIQNHGIPEQVVTETFALLKRFFALDIDTKMNAHVHKNPAIRGYEPMLETRLDPRTKGEPEQDYIGKTGRRPPPHITKPQNIWPAKAPWWREGLYNYYTHILPLAMKLVKLIALAFDLEETALDRDFEFPITGMRALYYPPTPADEESPSIGLGAHADFSWLTLVLQDSIPALEVLNQDGLWVEAPPKPGTFVCNVGQYLERQSNGKFPATVHRVRNRTGRERYSLPFFLTMDPDVDLEVLDSCVQEGEKPKYEKINVSTGHSYSSTGDPAYKIKPLSISRAILPEVLKACSFPPFALVAAGLKHFHLSHHVQYDDNDVPVALVLLLRIPRNSQSINVTMRIRLSDLATVCLFATMQDETGQRIILVFEDRGFDDHAWFDKLLQDINAVESATGMTRSTWRLQLSDKLMEWFSDYDNLLRSLYASHTELSHLDTVITFSIKVGRFLSDAVELLEALRTETGLAPMSRREHGSLQQRIQFSLSRCEMTSDKTKEMLERSKAQINVSIWSAGLFQLDEARNWKVYIGTTVALTAGVFAVWLVYLKWSGLKREKKPIHIAGLGYVREGRVAATLRSPKEGRSVDIQRESFWISK